GNCSFKTARRPEIKLSLIARIDKSRVIFIGEVSRPEREPGSVNARRPPRPFEIDEHIGIEDRILVHIHVVHISDVAFVDVADRGAYFDRPRSWPHLRYESIGDARISDDRRDVGWRVAVDDQGRRAGTSRRQDVRAETRMRKSDIAPK